FGDYKVTVTDTATGCSNGSNIAKVSDSVSSTVFVYPNPNFGQFQVRSYTFTNPTSHKITIYDSKGAVVYSKIYPVTRTYEKLDVNMNQAQAGVYHIVLQNAKGERIGTGKVIIY